MVDARSSLLTTLTRDLVGPQGGETEELSSRPGDQYMTGALYPQEPEPDQEEADDGGAAAEADDAPDEAVSMSSQRRPASMGISFAVEGQDPTLRITGSAGKYRRAWWTENGLSDKEGDRKDERWVRTRLDLSETLTVAEGVRFFEGPEGLRWCVRVLKGTSPGGNTRWQITVVLSNMLKPSPGRPSAEAATFFQAGFGVSPEGGRLVPRESRRAALDGDTEVNDLVYRLAREWAVGHTCGATWASEGPVTRVETTWLPSQIVPSMDEQGHAGFRRLSRERFGDENAAFSAANIGNAASPEQLSALLSVTTESYSTWIADQEAKTAQLEKSAELSRDQAVTARRQAGVASILRQRMEAGVERLVGDVTARRAFQLAQKAMVQQRLWTDGTSLTWRPFQLGFQLLAVSGLACESPDDEGAQDRAIMDLLWFPTGGGKTEAYLALIAYVLFHRRLRQESPDQGAGVAVLMRYTLRLLTIQQFERASRLILACELMRRKLVEAGDESLGEVPFSIGLWVGAGATPNLVKDARKDEGRLKARQLVRCPACGAEDCLHWDDRPDTERYVVKATGESCPFTGTAIPICTIDEEVYAVSPSLLIGTIDKFAQIVRNPATSSLLGGDGRRPPELIIQDELHLISGPLGTLAGLYEAALDQLCTWNGVPPKIIGSTATIRRAEDQVRSLFRRRVAQFPPPVLNAEDSCFAVVDRSKPGRQYVGATTAGRSPKFVLQAVCASMMQGAFELPEPERDPYWTLVAYFNSLRELGGALVMMYDDVLASIAIYAGSHGTSPRKIDEDPLELTSRVGSEDIPSHLDELAVRYPAQKRASVLATNMLSVGVDIPRLGAMVVNGQPKSMAEYIQATSRVGRNRVPGVIVTVYNAGRARDRSHFEAFRTWHQALYREVEATSVTPFAPRARDRGLHAAIVALARHRVSGLRSSPDLTDQRRSELETLVDGIIARAADVDSEEKDGVAAEAAGFLDSWQRRGRLKAFWEDHAPDTSLLVSAEVVAKGKARHGAWRSGALGTPNSMREVEPEVEFVMVPGLRPGQPSVAAADAPGGTSPAARGGSTGRAPRRGGRK